MGIDNLAQTTTANSTTQTIRASLGGRIARHQGEVVRPGQPVTVLVIRSLLEQQRQLALLGV